MQKKICKKIFACLVVCLFAASSMLSVCAEIYVSLEGLFDAPEDMTKQQRLERTIYFQNMNYAAACDGVLTVINPADKAATPIVRQDKLYIPLRFVLEYYGVDVSWEHETKTVIMTANEKEYRLSIEDSVMSFGEKTKQLANPCILNRNLTYVAFEDISEIITCNIYYFEKYNSGVIMAGEKWDNERQAEKDALGAMEFAVSPFFKMFV